MESGRQAAGEGRMKRTERHHLKQDELTAQFLHAREMIDARRREVTAALVAIVVIGAVLLGYFGWRERTNSRAHALLADAMAVQDARVGPPTTPGSPTPGGTYATERARDEAAVPKFKAAADAYPATDAGIFARYQEASLLMSLDRPAEAVSAFQEAASRGGEGIYGQMARLGLAEAQLRGGQYDQAIGGFRDLAQRKDGTLPTDAILMQLGRAYKDAGKTADAQQTFTRLVEEYPDSAYAADARRELEGLKKARG